MQILNHIYKNYPQFINENYEEMQNWVNLKTASNITGINYDRISYLISSDKWKFGFIKNKGSIYVKKSLLTNIIFLNNSIKTKKRWKMQTYSHDIQNTEFKNNDKYKSEIQAYIAKNLHQIQSVLPKTNGITKESVARIAMLEIGNNPSLMQCSPSSILNSIIQCTVLGLVVSGVLGHAYLVPYKKTCKFMLGYKGMIYLAMKSGKVKSINARIVYKEDDFSYELGMNETIKHIPKEDSDELDSNIKGAYCVITLDDYSKHIDYMSKKSIDKIRCLSKTGTIWNDHYAEMAKKTIIRRTLKYMPLSLDFQSCISASDAAENQEDSSYIYDQDCSQIYFEETKFKSKSDEMADILTVV